MGHERGDKKSTRASETAGIYQRERSPYWWCRFYDASGRRLLESTRCTDRKAALAYLARRQREEQDPGAAERAATTLRHVLKLLVAERQSQAESETASRSMATAEFYTAKSKLIVSHFGQDFPLGDLTAGALDDYVAKRRASKIKDSTIHKELTTIRAALGIAKRRDLWRGDLDALIPHVSGQSKPRERWLTEPELCAVLEDLIARKSFDRAARIAWVVATSSEWIATTRAERGDLTADGLYARVRGSKRETRDRDVPIRRAWQHDLIAIARMHAAGKGAMLFTPWLHSNSIRDLGLCAARVKIEPFSWNDLRRTCAQWLRREGVELELVSAILGHVDSRMVETTYGRLDARAIGDRLALR